jgi:hypothetical protein
MSVVVHATNPAVCLIGAESVAFGTASSSMVRLFPESVEVKLTREMHDVRELRTRGFAAQKKKKGFKRGTIKIRGLVRPHGTQLVDGATADSPSAFSLLMLAGFGGMQSGEGSLVASGALATGCSVTATEGSNFAQGQWVAVQSAAAALSPRRLASRSTDAIAWTPALSGAPSVGYQVVNGQTFYPTQTNQASLTFQLARTGNSTGTDPYQWTCTGCYVESVELTFEIGKMAEYEITLQVSDWTGPSDQSITRAAASDTQGAPFFVGGCFVMLQNAATSTNPTHVTIEKATVKFNTGLVPRPDFGGVNGRAGVMRIPARPFAEVAMTLPSDLAYDALFEAQTSQQLALWVPEGSGLTQRFFGVDVPSFYVSQKPDEADDGGRGVTTLTGEALEDETLSSQTTDLGFAPARVFLI